jgi:phospholipid/cholesterol/gamma-HCH transport system substrate-binding protein/paraquat-inducible protein B
VAIAGAILFVLGGRALFEPTYEFETYFDESVAGLDIGAPVRFRGVPMGQVVGIGLSTIEYELNVPFAKRRNYIVVRARVALEQYRIERLSLEAGAMVKQGLRAQTALAGITGQQYLALDLLDPDKYPPLPFEWKPRYTYVPSAPSLTSEIIANVQSFLAHLDRTDIQSLASNLNTLVVSLNKKVNEVPAHELGQEALATVRQAQQTLAAIDKVITRPEIAAMLGNLSKASGRLDGLLADPGLKQTVDNLAQTTERLRKLAASGELDRTVRSIDDLAQRLNGVVRDNQYDVRVIVQDLRTTADNLRSLSETLKRNPSGVLLGGPPERVPLPFGKTP